jgi:hypothetical protein
MADKPKTTTEKLTEMLEQQKRDQQKTVKSPDGSVTINCNNNSGVIVGKHRGDFNI